MNHLWTCRCCGKQYSTLPMSYALAAPDPWFEIAEEKRSERGELSSDTCVIDDAQFYVRGCVEIPVLGCNEPFVWSVWVSVSEESFERIGELWDTELRAGEPPFFGWLANNIPVYPSTFNLKTSVHLRDAGTRIFIELEPTGHPLAIEQRQGMTLQRVEEIAAMLLQHG